MLIEQAEHARQTGVFARALREAPEPRRDFERAAESHDDGWIEADAAPLFSLAGIPLSFREYPLGPYAELWERGIARAIAASPYVGLLVSLHGSRFFGHQPAVQAHLHAREDLLMRQLGIDGTHAALPAGVLIHHLWMDYLDRLSLMRCAGWPSPQRAEIAGVAYTASLAGETVTIEPWPFRAAFEAPVDGILMPAGSGAATEPRLRGEPVHLACAVRPA